MGSIITLSIVQSALELGFIYALVALALFISFSILNIAGYFDRWMFYIGMCRLCIGDACRSSDIGIICSDGSRCLLPVL